MVQMEAMPKERVHFRKAVFGLLKSACWGWIEHNASSMGAALAFYALFSLAPVLIVAVAIAGPVFGRHAAESEVIRQFQALMGAAGTTAVEAVIESVDKPISNILFSVLSAGALVLGSSGAFLELQNALNVIWKVKTQTESMWLGALRQRFFSFGLVLGAGFLLFVSLVVSAGLGALGHYFGTFLPTSLILLASFNFLFSFGGITFLLGAIFKFIPDARVAWRDVWFGAVTSSLLFSLGKSLFGAYLGHSALASSYGASASMVIFLTWIYYSAQILLLGAEVTYVYACKYGSLATEHSLGASPGG